MAKQPRSFLYRVLRLVSIMLAVLLALLLSVTLYVRHVLNQINYAPQDSIPTLTQEELDAYLATQVSRTTDDSIPTIQPEEILFEEHTTEIGGNDSEIINILLIGQDRREGEARARSDTMILCTFHKDAGTLTMTSFLRDLYVQIPGYRDDRINTAYAAGGMKLLNETLEKNFGIHIDGNIEVDFTRFCQIVDMLGGVTLELRQDEAKAINALVPGNVTAGTQWLSGSQTLAYARLRNLDNDGDFSRTNRQRKVIAALIKAYKDSDLSSVLSMLADSIPVITTDLSEKQLLRYTVELFPMLADATIVSQHIPVEGTYVHRKIRDMAVLVADMDITRAILEESLLSGIK